MKMHVTAQEADAWVKIEVIEVGSPHIRKAAEEPRGGWRATAEPVDPDPDLRLLALVSGE